MEAMSLRKLYEVIEALYEQEQMLHDRLADLAPEEHALVRSRIDHVLSERLMYEDVLQSTNRDVPFARAASHNPDPDSTTPEPASPDPVSSDPAPEPPADM